MDRRMLYPWKLNDDDSDKCDAMSCKMNAEENVTKMGRN